MKPKSILLSLVVDAIILALFFVAFKFLYTDDAKTETVAQKKPEIDSICDQECEERFKSVVQEANTPTHASNN